MLRIKMFIFLLLLFGMFFSSFSIEAQTIKDDTIIKECETFWNVFKSAVSKKDKKQILSLTNFPYFAYDVTTECDELISKENFFKNKMGICSYFRGYFLVSSNGNRWILKLKYTIKKFDIENYKHLDVFQKMPKNVLEELYQVDFPEGPGYGTNSYLILQTESSFLLFGEILQTNDN